MNKTRSNRSTLHALAACCLALMCAPVMAASTWNFSTCVGTASNQAATNNGTFGNSWSCAGSVAGNKVTASAWGAQTVSGNTTFQSAYLSPQGSSGFGVASRNEGIGVSAPNHAMDNDPASTNTPDLILLKFDTAVALDTVRVGWNQSDADLTVMAYTGVAAPTIQGKTALDLTSDGAGAGWSLVKNVGDPAPDLATGATSTDITRSIGNTDNVVSSWWLVSAYNSGYGGGTLDGVLDYVKLFSVASKDVPPNGKVSEPGTLAIAGIAILGLMGVRRRKQASKVS